MTEPTEQDFARWAGAVDARLDGIEAGQQRIEGKLDQLVTVPACKERHERIDATLQTHSTKINGITLAQATATTEATRTAVTQKVRWQTLVAVASALAALGALAVSLYKG